jgi:hypothetical protein
MDAPKFTFTFYRFTGTEGHRTTEITRDFDQADGMRGLIERSYIQAATTRVTDWASSKGISVSSQEPYPSEKYPGKIWLEFRFGGLTL